MAISVSCPGCGKAYNLADAMRGKKVRCKGCEQVFEVSRAAKPPAPEDDDDREDMEVDEEEVSSKSRARRGTRRARDDDEDEDEPPRRRKRKKQSSSLPLTLIIGGGGGVFLLLAVLVIGVMFLRSKVPTVPQQAQGPAPAPAGAPGANSAPNPARQAAAPEPGPEPFVPGGPRVQQGETPSVVLSNGKIGSRRPGPPGKSFTVDYRIEKGTLSPGMNYFLVIKSPQGSSAARLMGFRFQNQGTIQVQELGIGSGTGQGPYEAHLEMGHGIGGRFDPPRQTISNTVTLQP